MNTASTIVEGLRTKRDVKTLGPEFEDKVWDIWVTTFTDLSDMARALIRDSGTTGCGFYYEDPDDCEVNCYLEIIDGEASEAAVYRGTTRFESFTLGWMSYSELLVELMEILGSTEKECRLLKYSGGMARLAQSKIGGNYVQYAKDIA